MKKLLKFYINTKGSALIEFAFAVPILITLILGILEFSSVFFHRHQMLNAAERGAREVATQTLTSAEAVTEAQSMLAGWGATYTIVIQEPDPANINDRDVEVSISVPTGDLTITGFFNGVLPATVDVVTVMRQEG